MVNLVQYTDRILVDKDFMVTLLTHPEKEKYFIKLRYILNSSLYFKKNHTLILPNSYNELKTSHINNIGAFVNKINNYIEIVENDTLNDIDKNILCAIRLSQVRTSDKKRFDCLIFTSSNDKKIKYVTNKHMEGISLVNVVDYNTALKIIDRFFNLYQS